MKIVVIGGSGLIGSKLVNNLRQRGHEVVAASPSSGVNSLTGEGLTQALAGANVVVDVTNSPSWEDAAVLAFFETSTRNLLATEAAAGVGHHVALSVVGADRLPESGYMRAKVAQEKLIKAGTVPYTIVRATQFFEFAGGIAQSATEGQTVRLPSALMQPIVSDDVAAALADIAVGEPRNGTIELAGPEPIRMDDLVRRFLSAKSDERKVTTDTHARYYGTELNDQSLTPGANPRIGPTRFGDWLARSVSQGRVWGSHHSGGGAQRALSAGGAVAAPNRPRGSSVMLDLADLGWDEWRELGPRPGEGAVVHHCSGEADFDGLPGDELPPREAVKRKLNVDAPAPPERFAD